MKIDERRQVYELYIKTGAAKLWQSLTDGSLTPHYFFGTIVRSSFKKGESISYEMPNGATVVDGTVLECESQKRLVHTWKIGWDPALSDETSTVEWQLETHGDACKVIVIHDVSTAPKTSAHLSRGEGGWTAVLSGLKTYVETGAPLGLSLAG